MIFISFRRHYLDLHYSKVNFHGKVLDVGGKKDSKRGTFRPPLDQVKSWEYLNLDQSTNPDYECSADNIPVEANTFDFIILSEVLEHLENPGLVLAECQRVLKPEGQIICTMPFLYNLHADPYDYQRWLPAKINLEFNKAGFQTPKIEAMGGLLAVLWDLCVNTVRHYQKIEKKFYHRFIFSVFYKLLLPVFLHLEKKSQIASNIITTGYYFEAKK
ncbi:MAG: class I SAM-dependent methyltransferase [Candidatus Cloacimonetes bacterium]|nr:class I SAM-dependent methyltransferase [Candidatus Cloacimonadota bacterium]